MHITVYTKSKSIILLTFLHPIYWVMMEIIILIHVHYINHVAWVESLVGGSTLVTTGTATAATGLLILLALIVASGEDKAIGAAPLIIGVLAITGL